jgi:TonB family protein
MMRERFAVISLMLAAACATAQTTQPAMPTPAAAPSTNTTPSPNNDLTIHYKGPGVTAPEFLSINGTFDAIDHCKKLDGDEQILIAVDRTGTPQMIKVLKSLGNDLDAMALHIVELDKFKPGTVDSLPSVVALADDIKLQACRMEKKDERGQKQDYVQLRAAPEQTFELIEPPKYALTKLPPKPGTAAWNKPMQHLPKIGSGVTPPVILHQVDPEYSEEARRAQLQGVCLITIIVDVNGNPQDPMVVKPLGLGLDEEALKAVKRFRFKPAMKDGKTPVPVQITVAVNFRM